jgi:hypothetical protein
MKRQAVSPPTSRREHGLRDRRGLRLALGLTLLALMTSTAGWTADTIARAAPKPVVIPIDADARVERDHPNTNYGGDPELRVDGGATAAVSYLRFAVNGVDGEVRRATLRVYALGDTAAGPTVATADSDWSEAGITWANRPMPASTSVQGATDLVADSWAEYDVTGLVAPNTVVTFVLATPATDGVRFSSREGSKPAELVISVAGATTADTPTPTTGTPGAAASDPVVVAAGDIACDPANGAFNHGNGTASSCRQKYTAQLVQQIAPDAVLGLGDFQYEKGTLANYRASYDLSWGAFKDITYPTAGPTHDTEGRGDYYAYWGKRAGPSPDQTWYSFDLGAWHIISLNANCSVDIVGGCDPGSREYEWLKADLAASTASCTLAFWHQPRYSSGERHGDDAESDPFWDLLYQSGADIVLSGHDHDYERFAPMDSAGRRDDGYGIREIVVGTGGKFLYGFGAIRPNSEIRNGDTFGVLKLTLHEKSYDWAFVPEESDGFTDSGTADCHGAPPAKSAETNAPHVAAAYADRYPGSTGRPPWPARAMPGPSRPAPYTAAQPSPSDHAPGVLFDQNDVSCCALAHQLTDPKRQRRGMREGIDPARENFDVVAIAVLYPITAWHVIRGTVLHRTPPPRESVPSQPMVLGRSRYP